MISELPILANRRNSPRRHGDHRDDPRFADDGYDPGFILWVLCVSVVRNPYAKQSQFSDRVLRKTTPIVLAGGWWARPGLESG